MTNVDFAHQLAEHRRGSQQPPLKKFKSSAAPKGTKYTEGYQDRASLRKLGETEGASEDDKAQRVQALEEMMKLGQIDRVTFEKLRTEIGIGGDVGTTHLVKGLDRDLLKRIKAGEDVSTKPIPVSREDAEDEAGGEAGGDEDFEQLLEEKEKAEVVPAAKKEKEKKRGNLAPSLQAKGGRLTRDEILKQLKASRAPPPPPESMLGSRFKKVGGDQGSKKRWIEQDKNGRRKEILVTTDSAGKVKRKVRWLDGPGEKNGELLAVDKNAKPLGMDVPIEALARTQAQAPESEEDDNIFEGIGDDYNPLAGISDDEDNSSASSGDEDGGEPGEIKDAKEGGTGDKPSIPTTSKAPHRDYFATNTKSGNNEADKPPEDSGNPLISDPTILQALKRAAAIRQPSPSSDAEGKDDDKDAILRRKKFLEEAKRREREDAMDMDLGFGGSRFADDDDEEQIWDEQRGGSNKRKRGPKKKKGDKESVSDVMGVLEGRQKAAGKDKDKRKAE